jgi:hypothetical protein
MQFIVTMPSVITNGTISQFDVFGTGVGSQVFMVIINNANDLDTHTNLTLRYRVEYFMQGVSSPILLYEGLSNRFTIAPNEYVPAISSTDFLKKNNPLVKVSLKTTIFELPNSDPLKKKFLDAQTIPDGKIRYTMILEQNGVMQSNGISDHIIINTTKVELVTPGSYPSGAIMTLYDPRPLFIWNSDLPPYIYGADDVFELRIYKAQSGESFAGAMSRIPVIKTRTKILQYKLPDAGYQFIPGSVYYWEVIGFVKGMTTSEIRSSPFCFKMSKPVNVKMQEIINTLRLTYGEDILEKIYDYDSDVTLKIDGQVIEIGELKALVQKILSGEYAIQFTTVD